MADIFDLGFSPELDRTESPSESNVSPPSALQAALGAFQAAISSGVENQTSPTLLGSGSMQSILFSGKTTFTDSTAGYRMGVDQSDNIYKWIIGDASSSIDWAVTTAATLTITGAGIVSPSIRYGKTSFTDSTNAGYFISALGVYIGAASDTTVLKYTVATGLIDLIGTISSRSTATLASAINSSGNLVTDLINARIDSSAKTILADFNFGSGDYAGGVKAGTITWNTTTGAITGGSGIVVYRGGIVGAAAGVATFSIDAATGSATFAGALSAVTGSLGALSVLGSLNVSTAGNIKSGQTAYNTGTGWFLEYNSGTPRFSIGDGTTTNSLTWDGSTLRVNGSTIANNFIFGDGNDGAVTISVDTDLTRDMYYSSLTVNSGKTLSSKGYRIYCTGTTTVNGTIENSGGNGADGSDVSGGAGGVASDAGTLLAGVAGVSGAGMTNGQAPGNDGTSVNPSAGASGGAGGTPSGTTSGAAGTATATKQPPRSAYACDSFVETGTTIQGIKGGASGGTGGVNAPGASRGASGGSGAGGGIVFLSSRIITVGAAGSILAEGGNAGVCVENGGPSAVSGSGGGGGGCIVLRYSTLTNGGAISADGGLGSEGLGVGGDGANGSNGNIIQLLV